MKKQEFKLYPEDALLSPQEVRDMIRVSRPKFDELIEEGVFPQCIKISNRIRRWYKKDIDLWLKNRIKK